MQSPSNSNTHTSPIQLLTALFSLLSAIGVGFLLHERQSSNTIPPWVDGLLQAMHARTSAMRSLPKQGQMFDGKVLLVTGASSGIGLATSKLIRERCGTVVMLARNETKLNIAIAEVGKIQPPSNCMAGSPKLLKTVADTRNTAQLRTALQSIKQNFGRLDAAVNNAGVSGPIMNLDDPKMDEWIYSRHDAIENNLYGTINSIRVEIEFWKQMNVRTGTIVNTASINSFIACGGCSLYVASKFGIAGVTKSVALEYAAPSAQNNNLTLRINAVAPGMVDTPLTRNQGRFYEGLQPFQCMKGGKIVDEGCPDIGENDPLYKRLVRDLISSGGLPAKRIINPTEIANVITFLASDLSSAATGDIFSADGAITA